MDEGGAIQAFLCRPSVCLPHLLPKFLAAGIKSKRYLYCLRYLPLNIQRDFIQTAVAPGIKPAEVFVLLSELNKIPHFATKNTQLPSGTAAVEKFAMLLVPPMPWLSGILCKVGIQDRKDLHDFARMLQDPVHMKLFKGYNLTPLQLVIIEHDFQKHRHCHPSNRYGYAYMQINSAPVLINTVVLAGAGLQTTKR